MVRLIGALLRAGIVVAVILLPTFFLHSVSRSNLELSLIIGVIVGLYAMFEYVSRTPGFVDFRFAPPYNRLRVGVIAVQVVLISLLLRPEQVSQVQDLASAARSLFDWPFSPVNLALASIDPGDSAIGAETLARALALSLSIGLALGLGFSALLWASGWPFSRETFNVWANLPTMKPADPRRTIRQLRRDGLFNIMVAIAAIYALPAIAPLIQDILGTDLTANPLSVVWAATLWGFLPAALLIRSFGILKIGWILARVKRVARA